MTTTKTSGKLQRGKQPKVACGVDGEGFYYLNKGGMNVPCIVMNSTNPQGREAMMAFELGKSAGLELSTLKEENFSKMSDLAIIMTYMTLRERSDLVKDERFLKILERNIGMQAIINENKETKTALEGYAFFLGKFHLIHNLNGSIKLRLEGKEKK